MNFTERITQYQIYLQNIGSKPNPRKDDESNRNLLNQKILDAILDDDNDTFIEIILQSFPDSNPNGEFILTNYKLPDILKYRPSYASLCAFFGAEKCFNSISMLFSGGLESDEMKKLDDFYRSPLHFACAGGNLEIIRELLQANIDLNIKDCEECTPSCYAAMSGHLDVLKYLWMKGAEILPKAIVFGALNPFEIGCLYGHLSVVKFIYETILANEKNMEVKQLLFSKRYSRVSTPLHFACQGGHEDVVDYLLSMKDVIDFQLNSFDHQQRTPLVCACQNGSLKCVKLIIGTGKVDFSLYKKKRIPLIEASSCGHIDIVKFLLSLKEVSIQEENSQQMNSLHVSILNKHPEVIQYLINHGALSNYDDSKLGELFMDACRSGDIQILRILDSSSIIPYHKKSGTVVSYWAIRNDFILDEETTWGDKYMQQACLLESEELISFLLSKNCNFQRIDLSNNVKKDWSPFMDFITLNGANLNSHLNTPPIVATIKSGNLKRVLKMISMGAILNKEIISKYDCVLVACSGGKLDLFKFLMKYNPIVNNSEACLKRCILGFAREQVKNKKKAIKVYYYMAEELLKTQNINLNEGFGDFHFQFPITLAASLCAIEMLELFENYGADFTHCPLNFSRMNTSKHFPVYKFLEERGCIFDNSISFGFLFSQKLNEKKSSALEALLYNTNAKNIDPEILIFLLKYANKDDIINFDNNYGNVTDAIMKLESPKALLMVFQKANSIILPKRVEFEEFTRWIMKSKYDELINFVKNKIILHE